MRKIGKITALTLTMLLSLSLSGLAVSLDKTTKEKTGFLGVYLEDLTDDLRESMNYDGDGVFIEDVQKDTPAEKAGIAAGDIIIKYAGKKVEDTDYLRKLIKNTKPGDKAKIEIIRDGKQKTVTAKIGDRSDIQKHAFKHKHALKHKKGKFGDKREFHFFMDEPHCFQGFSKDGAFLGIHMDDMSEGLADYFEVKGGALVTEVIKDAPAEKSGIKEGDVIVEFNGRKVEDTGDLSHFIKKTDPGDKVDLKVIRRGKAMTFNVELAEAPEKDGCHPRLFKHLGDKMKHLDIDLEELEHLGEGLEDISDEIEDKAKGIKIKIKTNEPD